MARYERVDKKVHEYVAEKNRICGSAPNCNFDAVFIGPLLTLASINSFIIYYRALAANEVKGYCPHFPAYKPLNILHVNN